jgi:hypothetical protein
MKVRMVVMALVMACLLLATACGASGQPEPVKTTRATTTAAPSLWLEHYPWDLKTQVDRWITNCEDIQTQFDVIYEARDGYKRRFGRNGSDILEYLHQIGKRMGCEDFQW